MAKRRLIKRTADEDMMDIMNVMDIMHIMSVAFTMASVNMTAVFETPGKYFRKQAAIAAVMTSRRQCLFAANANSEHACHKIKARL